MIALIIYLAIVFASTVFTRMPSVRKYELIPFWSWYEVIVHHSKGLLIEIILNVILLLPVGLLLPIIFDKRIQARDGFLVGAIISAVIETSQLVFKRGLFEWDDMLHNALGCMVGCIVMNVVMNIVMEKCEHKNG